MRNHEQKKILILVTILSVVFLFTGCREYWETWFAEIEIELTYSFKNDTQVACVGLDIIVDGSGSSHGPDDTVKYVWSIKEKPVGSNSELRSVSSSTATEKTKVFTPDVAGKYTIKLEIMDDFGSSQSTEQSFDVIGPPTSSSANFYSIETLPERVSFSWPPVSDATDYKLLRGTSPSGPFQDIVYSGPDLSCQDTSVEPGSIYYYSLIAFNPAGDGPETSVKEIITPLYIPSNFLLVGNTANSAMLQWDISVNASEYIVQKRKKTENSWIEAYRGSSLTKEFIDLEPYIIYFFKIKAINEIVESNWSSPELEVILLGEHMITASAGIGGSITPAGEMSVTHGDDKTFLVTPDSGHETADVLVDGTSVGRVSSYTFPDVTEDHTISASFMLDGYTIMASAGVGGSITPAGEVSVTHGDDRTFLVTPDSGYETVDVLVDGTSAGRVPSYTFIDVTEDHTISASFMLGEYTIIFDKNSSDATGNMQSETVVSGETITLPAVGYSRPGYNFSGWSTSPKGGVEYLDRTAYTIDSSDVKLYAQWEGNSYTITFEKNDDDATGVMQTQNTKSGAAVNLIANRYSKVGSFFAGWSITPDDPVMYGDQAIFMIGLSDVTLYAQWIEVINLVPIDGFSTIDTTPEFHWSDVSVATGYHFQIVHNLLDFNDIDFVLIDSNNYVPPEVLENMTTYYWRVRIVNEEIYGSWTSPNTLTLNFGEITDMNPMNGSETADTIPTFSWGEVQGAVKYDIQISEIETGVENAPIKSIMTNSFTPTKALENMTTYYWRVRAINDDGVLGEWSSITSIYINWLGQVVDLVPVNGSTTIDQTPRLSWNVNDSAVQYEFQISKVGAEIAESDVHIITSNFFYPENNLEIGKKYQWRVRAKDIGGAYGSWSDSTSFTVSSHYVIRDVRPRGSIIFYDKGTYNDGWRYLEVAPYGWFDGSEDPDVPWGEREIRIGGTEWSIGSGKDNTERIINVLGDGHYAAKICEEANICGYNDWFLPSYDELDQIYQVLYVSGIGGFTKSIYWSSTESDAKEAWRKGFTANYTSDLVKGLNLGVRPVRAF